MKKSFKIRGIKFKDEQNRYPDNLHILKEHSFFNIENEIFCIKFPVPSKIFNVREIYNFSNGNNLRIVIHISDKNTNNAQNGKKRFMVSCFFSANDLVNVYGSNIKLKENSNVSIIVYNDNRIFSEDYIKPEDFELIENYYIKDNKIEIKKIFVDELPDEKEGGVIVEGP